MPSTNRLVAAALTATVAASLGCGDSAPTPRAKRPAPAPSSAERPAKSGRAVEPETPPEAAPPAKPSAPSLLVPGYRLLAATLPRPDQAPRRAAAEDADEDEDRLDENPLPARVTLLWKPDAQQTKLYVGQTFTGALEQDGLPRCLAKCRQILDAGGVPGIEIDAAPDVPWECFLRVYAALRSLPAEQLTFAAGSPADATPTEGIGGVPARLPGWTPPTACAVDGSEDVRWPAKDEPLCLAIDPAVGYAVRFGPKMTPTAMRYDEFGPYLRELVKRRPAVPGTELSTLKLALFMPAKAAWRDAQFVLMTSASLGVWDIAFAVAAESAVPRGGSADQGK